MENVKFTKGPWRTGRSDMTTYTLFEGEDGGPWKYVYWDDPNPITTEKGERIPSAVARAYGRTDDEALSNAALIAAAPELYGALDEAPTPDCEDFNTLYYRWYYEQRNPAIAKAEGREGHDGKD